MTQHSSFQFAGRTLAELADIAGTAPAYVYSIDMISRTVQEVRRALPNAVKLHYSIKANPHALTVAHLADQVDGMDVASHAEMLQAIGSGLAPERISFSGPGKTDSELTSAVVVGITIHAESISEIERIAVIAKRSNKTPNIALRINPDYTVRQSGMVMGGGSQPFGIDLDQIDCALYTLKKNGLSCAGLHCYAGSQMLNATLISELQERTLHMMLDIVKRHSLMNISLNLGGGFGIPYFDHETPLDIHCVGIKLNNLLSSIEKEIGIREVIVELGRYLIAESGIYIAQVIERKQSRGKQYLVVQGGMNHHLAASGNLGQTIRRNYPVVGCPHPARPSQDFTKETVTIVGPLCTPLDVLATDVHLPVLQAGDHIAVLNSGAYGFSASPHGFLSHPPPIELLL